jgi:hypothetical protein
MMADRADFAGTLVAGKGQLVPMSQKDRLAANLAKATGLRVAQGHRLTGKHAARGSRAS